MLLRSEEGLPETAWQNKVASMKPSALNKICAHPMIVTWVLGACVLDAVIIISLISQSVSLSSIISDWQTMLLLVWILIPSTGLGFFVGMFTCWPFVRIFCSRYNGAPLKVGDQVLILTGPQRGKIVEIYLITVGQGGWELANVDLGEERRDIFEEYSLLKIKDKLQTASSPA
jgi:hypothetical protein